MIEGSTSGITSLGAHVFVSAQGEAVLHDIFLDGNTWQHSQSVDKKPLVGDLSVGASFSINMFKLTYRHLFRTEQFDGQKKRPYHRLPDPGRFILGQDPGENER